ncbi:MAG TPA: VOC family protein [Lachnospiraceae bacterium]|nr:VOC family protein [Lachnospiraceae bacterium]
MVKRIGHAAFNVKDMERSIAFYENSMGFRKAFSIKRPETGEPWIEYIYAGGDQFIELFYGGTNEIPYSDENIGFFHMCVEVDDIQEAWKMIVDTGAPQDEAPKQGVDLNWQCWTHDPDGNKIELMQLSEEGPQKKFIKSLKIRK